MLLNVTVLLVTFEMSAFACVKIALRFANLILAFDGLYVAP